ncbi:MAG: hypothetical protein NVS2B9_07160 [Myxococcales bacterium]
MQTSSTAARRRRVVLLELNELSPSLVDRFIGEGRLPAFQQLRSESHLYVTESAERAPFLDPWVEWITVHSGLDYADHQILNLGDGHRLGVPNLWDYVCRDGGTAWVCGSMNISYAKPLRGAVLPDPWAFGVDPSPESLRPYFSFVRHQVLDHTNPEACFRAQDYLSFLRFMVSRGLRFGTCATIARQLAREKVSKVDVRWKRATLLDALQMDVFRSLYRELKPDLATFFSNSTAHFQHLYWRNLDPTPFKLKPTAAEQAAYSAAIRTGYENHDRLIRDAVQLAGKDAVIIFCSALSQQPCVSFDDEGGKHLYRPRNFDAFVAACGVADARSTAPDMAERFQVLFDSEVAAGAAREQLDSATYRGRKLLLVAPNGKQLMINCSLYDDVDQGGNIEGRGFSIPFRKAFYQMEGIKSGMHHPTGLFWIRLPEREHRVFADAVPLNRVAPTVLSMYGLRKPPHMRGDALPHYAPSS